MENIRKINDDDKSSYNFPPNNLLTHALPQSYIQMYNRSKRSEQGSTQTAFTGQ